MTTKNWLLMGTAVAALTARAQAPLEATVETSAGKPQRLGALWGKPTVLFYEDRDSTKLNQHVKDALFKAGREKGLLDAVGVVAVANVASFDWFPARHFVLDAVKAVEKDVRIPVLLDFRGAMAKAPWGLSAKSSTVLVVDERGVQQLKFEGRLSERDVATLFDALEKLAKKG